jgi:hypothetical protein
MITSKDILKTNLPIIPRIKITEADDSFIGKKVFKKSCSPFKSGSKIATVKGFVYNDVTAKISFTFEEDDSSVECFRCKVIPEELL